MIYVIVPTIRETSLLFFEQNWDQLFKKHKATVIYVHDGEKPYAEINNGTIRYYLERESDELKELIYNRTDAVRNYGFYIAGTLSISDEDIFITLDDDTKPVGDTIQDHIDALTRPYPISWIGTSDYYTRGFPYGVRDEAEAVLSHGVWEGVADWDAPTQLVLGNPKVSFYRGSIPKGIFYPMCGMNIAFKKKMLPYMYFAPMGYKVGMDRFADIWLGIVSKRIIDEKGWAVVTGYSKVQHDRASNVWKNLQKEARGLELNETFWQGVEDDPYFKDYALKRQAWEELVNEHLC